MNNVVFIIGSPRSGTTILENILGCHHEIAEWYEPYYVWERYFSCKDNDIWQAKPEIADSKSRHNIQNEYRIFGELSRKKIILDKLPTHVFNIRTIHRIFPEAKWIHIIRDGRDVTLSIKKEWERRKEIVERRNFGSLLSVTMSMLNRQPFLRYKLMAIFNELRSTASINPLRYLNKSRWNGNVGWGPRFEGWQYFLENHSTLEFNTMQWVQSVEAAHAGWTILPERNKMEIRYEDLIQNSVEILKKICKFLSIVPEPDFFNSIPGLRKDNFNKWKTAFTPQEKALIGPIISNLLIQLGYEKNDSWYINPV